MKKYFGFIIVFIFFSSTTYSQNLGFGLFGRLHPKVTLNKLYHNQYLESEYDNQILTGIFVSYRFSSNSPTTFSLRYSYGQKHLSEPPQYLTSSTTKYINFYTIEFSILYGINIAKDLKLKVGIVPGLYFAMLEDKTKLDKNYIGSKFSISPLATLSFSLIDKIDLDFSAIYSLEKIKVPMIDYFDQISQQWASTSDFDEFDFKGFNFSLSATYWIDI